MEKNNLINKCIFKHKKIKLNNEADKNMLKKLYILCYIYR